MLVDLGNHNGTFLAEPPTGPPVAIFAASVQLALIFLVGAAGNGIFLAAIIRKLKKTLCGHHRGTVPNIMLLFLVVCDLATMIMCVPTSYVIIYQVILSPSACRVAKFLNVVLRTHSLLLLMVGVPVERYIAICHTHRTFTRRQAIVMNVTLLMLGTANSLPDLIVPKLYPWQTVFGSMRCFSVLSLLAFLLQLVLIGGIGLTSFLFLYGFILRKIWVIHRGVLKQMEHGSDEGLSSANKACFSRQFIKDTRLTYIMLGTAVIRFVIWLPMLLVAMELIPFSDWYEYVYLVNNATTFVFLGLSSASMRKEMQSVLRSWWCKKKGSQSQGTGAPSQTQ